MRHNKRLAVAREFSRLAILRAKAPFDLHLFGRERRLVPAGENSPKWKDEARLHCWLDGKPCVTFLSRRGMSDNVPFEIWRARTQVLAGRKKRRAKAA